MAQLVKYTLYLCPITSSVRFQNSGPDCLQISLIRPVCSPTVRSSQSTQNALDFTEFDEDPIKSQADYIRLDL
jgi:hypothetical protein